MKIKALHYVFGPCMKGYDINEKRVTVQMGQKTIGLSGELLSKPELLPKLEELSFGDAVDPNTPFDKVYFTGLPGGYYVIGRGIRVMDSAGRKAFFFHHLVIEEPELIKIQVNPFAVIRRFQFFENESELPEDRLIPPTEIDIREEDCRFPVVDALNRPVMENLLADLTDTARDQPVWVIIQRGEECLFIEQLLGLLPILHRRQIGYSTDFFNSYNIQHYFRLVTVNTEQEYPYNEGGIYNFAAHKYPGRGAAKNDYLNVVSGLPVDEVRVLVEDLGFLQLYYRDSVHLGRCREILHKNITKGKTRLSAFFEQVPTEAAVVILGIGHAGAEPDYDAFTGFYGSFIDRVEPGWFSRLYGNEPVPLELFIAFFRLLERHENNSFRNNVIHAVEERIKATGSGEILNLLAREFPRRWREILDISAVETPRLVHLVQLSGLETALRVEITQRITGNLLGRAKIYETDMEIGQLPPLIDFLENQGISTAILKVLHEMYTLCRSGECPQEGVAKYSLAEPVYREVLRIAMNTVNDRDFRKLFFKMCDYVYDAAKHKVFFRYQLALCREPELVVEPEEILIHLETRGWVNREDREEIFEFMEEGLLKMSRVNKYREFLKKADKDLPEYEPLWTIIEENARRGLVGSLVRKVRNVVGI